ncbi:MAG: hypothetical protein ABI402_21450 [Ferruginibacter sp.]
MKNKIVLKKDAVNKSKSTENKQKNPAKKSSGFVAAAVGRSAVDAVKANSSKDVRGSSGLANTGTIISYE